MTGDAPIGRRRRRPVDGRSRRGDGLRKVLDGIGRPCDVARSSEHSRPQHLILDLSLDALAGRRETE